MRCLPPPSSPPHPDCLAMQGDARRVAPETAASARATSLEMSRRSEREFSPIRIFPPLGIWGKQVAVAEFEKDTRASRNVIWR